jgi:hypothetical protein
MFDCVPGRVTSVIHRKSARSLPVSNLTGMKTRAQEVDHRCRRGLRIANIFPFVMHTLEGITGLHYFRLPSMLEVLWDEYRTARITDTAWAVFFMLGIGV